MNAYSFSKALTDGLAGRSQGMTLLELLDFCAIHDFDAIDPTGYFFPGYPKVPADEYINKFKRRAFELGIDISGTGVRNNFASPDKASRAADVKHVKEWIEVAAKLGRARSFACLPDQHRRATIGTQSPSGWQLTSRSVPIMARNLAS